MAEDSGESGATAVITHRIGVGRYAEYESWLDEISPRCKAAKGFLDWQIVRPIPELTETYTVIIRFASVLYLQQWMGSIDRAQLIAKVQPLLVADDDFFISSGLDFWFAPPQAKAKVPVRWKQYLVTWSAILPLAYFTPIVLAPLLQALGVAQQPFLATLVITGVMVFLMVYIVMPRYTKLLRTWLFK